MVLISNSFCLFLPRKYQVQSHMADLGAKSRAGQESERSHGARACLHGGRGVSLSSGAQGPGQSWSRLQPAGVKEEAHRLSSGAREEPSSQSCMFPSK